MGFMDSGKLYPDGKLFFPRTRNFIRRKAEESQFFSVNSPESLEAVAFFLVSPGNNPDCLVVKVLIGLCLVQRVNSEEIRFHIDGMTPESTDRIKGLWDLFLNRLGDIFLGEIGTVFHFPREKVLGMLIEITTFLVFCLFDDFKPHLGENQTVFVRSFD